MKSESIKLVSKAKWIDSNFVWYNSSEVREQCNFSKTHEMQFLKGNKLKHFVHEYALSSRVLLHKLGT